MYPRTSRRNGCCSNQQSFHQLLKVVGENGLEWPAIVRKKHLGGTKRLKKLFKQRKIRSRPGYRTDCHLIRNPGTQRFEKRQLWQKSWEEFSRRLDSNYFLANKVFWQTICRLPGKRSSITYSIKNSDGNILTDENEILSRWREYFEGLLNPVKTSTRDTYEVTHLGEDDVFTAAEVATAIKGIKSEKAAGEDEIRPEMLKALTGEGILWLTRVCQVEWKLGKTPRDWQTGVIIPIFKKGDRKQCTNYRGISLLIVCQGKYMPNALKGNAEK